MKCSKISWAASFDLQLKSTKAANVEHDILWPVFILRTMQAHLLAKGRSSSSLRGFLRFDSNLFAHGSKNNDV